jgi:hypothetical protein
VNKLRLYVLAGVTVGFGIVLTSGFVYASTSPPRASRPPVAAPANSPRGTKAIQPHLAGGDPTKAAFTQDDVRAWVQQHATGTTKIAAGPVFTIEDVEFMRGADVRKRLGLGSTTLSDEALLCLVTLSGSFRVAGSQGMGFTSHHSQLLFDARTGNLLMNSA